MFRSCELPSTQSRSALFRLKHGDQAVAKMLSIVRRAPGQSLEITAFHRECMQQLRDRIQFIDFNCVVEEMYGGLFRIDTDEATRTTFVKLRDPATSATSDRIDLAQQLHHIVSNAIGKTMTVNDLGRKLSQSIRQGPG